MMRLPYWLIGVLLSALTSGTSLAGVASASDDAKAVLTRTLHALNSGFGMSVDEADSAAIAHFYEERSYTPVWFDGDGPTAAARDLSAVLENAGAEGLDPVDYAPARTVLSAGRPSSSVSLAEADVLVSAALLRYYADLSHGRVAPAHVDPELFLRQQDFDRVAVLRTAAASQHIEAYLHIAVPQSDDYRRLRDALALYRAIAVAGGWSVTPSGPTLHLGDRHPHIPALRVRLAAEAYLAPADLGSDLFDAPLAAAVRGFQSRHGLTADGVVGANTSRALSVPVERRIEQIALNMERLRWRQVDYGRRYIVINIAAFDLTAFEDGNAVLSMRIVVGQLYRRTPVFSADLTHLEVNPYWYVPQRIARHDIATKAMANSTYLSDNGFVVSAAGPNGAEEVDPRAVDWSAVAAGQATYLLRQSPGPRNALGQIKFVLPNTHDIFLHDTPAHALFRQDVRAFSSGCIRLERPIDLARYVLLDGTNGSVDRLDALLRSGASGAIRLDQAVRVHLTYATAWADNTGQAHFRADIYDRDARLAKALGYR